MDFSTTSEYLANLKRIEAEYPDDRLLSKKQMMNYLGLKNALSLNRFEIDTKLTRESFAMRLTMGGREKKEEKADDDKTVDAVSVL